MSSRIRLVGRLALLFPLLMGIPGAGAGEGDALDRLLLQVQQEQQHDTVVRREREARFRAEHADRRRLLDELKARLDAERQRSRGLKERFEANETELAALETELQQRVGNLGEVFGTVRQSAKDLSTFIEESPVSAQYPGRGDWLRGLGESKALPEIDELERLWQLVRQEVVESGRVVRFSAPVIGTDGVAGEREVVRVGLFNTVAGDRYLRYLPEAQRFVEPPRQPAAADREAAATLATSRDGYAPLALDPTRGVLLGMLVETPNLRERIQQGGMVGYVIIALGLLGLLVAGGRLAYLALVGRRMRRQLETPESPRADNPLGRVLALRTGGGETRNLELQIDEAILRETPRLTRGEGFVKLLAGVAPLLGLLGTVVGMIVTFQAISLFGTGDPKLMAGGISQALVTTALGLIVAVPLLFLHALVATRSRALVRLLDEQSASLIAIDDGQG